MSGQETGRKPFIDRLLEDLVSARMLREGGVWRPVTRMDPPLPDEMYLLPPEISQRVAGVPDLEAIREAWLAEMQATSASTEAKSGKPLTVSDLRELAGQLEPDMLCDELVLSPVLYDELISRAADAKRDFSPAELVHGFRWHDVVIRRDPLINDDRRTGWLMYRGQIVGRIAEPDAAGEGVD